MKNNLLMSTIAATLMLGAIVPQSAKAEVLMRVAYVEGQWFLTVPDSDTTVSAYGRRLRLYDVHIAKMIEVTHSQCIRPPRADASPEENGSRIENYDWSYVADQGRTERGQFMGHFIITCELAQSLVNTYGLGSPEATEVWFEDVSARMIDMTMDSRTEKIPTLDIAEGEAEEWMDFTSNFKSGRQ